jgi:hypothetical protein
MSHMRPAAAALIQPAAVCLFQTSVSIFTSVKYVYVCIYTYGTRSSVMSFSGNPIYCITNVTHTCQKMADP